MDIKDFNNRLDYENKLYEIRDENTTGLDVLTHRIDEDKIARILQRINDEDRDFFIITAYRGDNSKKENVTKNKELRSMLNDNRLGVYSIIGHWMESPDGIKYEDCPEKDKNDVLERSYLVIRNDEVNEDHFITLGLDLARVYNQDAIVLCCGKYKGVYTPSGAEDFRFTDSSIRLGALNRAYSEFIKKGITFAFEGIEVPDGIGYAKLGFKKQGFLW